MAERAARRLAAILAADVVGYSRLMGADEAGTLAALRQLRTELFVPAVADVGGTVVKRMGDGWLVEFPSISDAVACALKVQQSLTGDQTVQLRIGVHLGDITHEDEDIYGDGVNIAARLQNIAAPGSVVISDIARRSLDAAHAGDFTDAGERRLNNIAEPVRLFAWGEPPAPVAETARPEGLTFAVLPFRTVSDAGDEDLLREGILTDLTDSVSRLKWLRVIAAGTTRQFAPEDRDIAAIGRELNADYLLDGDLRKAGERVRASVRLIDAKSGRQLSADRFDGRYADLFDLQDDIVARVIGVIEPNLMEAEYEALKRRPTQDIDLWPQIVELRRAAYSMRPEELDHAVDLADRILQKDPDNAYACGLAAYALITKIGNGWHDDPQEGFKRMGQFAQRGVALDPTNELCQCMAATIDPITGHAWSDPSSGDAANALKRIEDAVARDPSSIYMRAMLAFAFARRGRLPEVLRETEIAERLSPRDPNLFLFFYIRGLAGYFAGDFEEAIVSCPRSIALQPNHLPSRRVQIVALLSAGREQEASEALAELMAISPDETAAKLRAAGLTTEKTLNALTSIGLPKG